MAAEQYQQEDVMPIVLITMKHIEAIYLACAMKYAIRYHFPDLNGLVDLNLCDQATIDLCQQADHPVCKVLFDLACQYSAWVQNYVKPRNICVNELYQNHWLRILAEDFRSVFFDDLVRQDDDADELEVIAFSIAHAMHCLCELVIYGQTDTSCKGLHVSYRKTGDGRWIDYVGCEKAENHLVAVLAEKAADGFYTLVTLMHS